MFRSLFLLLLVYSPLCLVSQTIWYINAAAAPGGDGLSWARAFPDLHTALSKAAKGDAVWVARGQYVPDGGNNRARAFVLPSGVRLYGGFAGTETDPGQRDTAANTTTLSGNIGNPLDSTDNAYTILYMAFPDSTTLVDGFTFRHGYAASDTSFNNFSPTRSGGAVYIHGVGGTATPVFNRCTFRDNVAAGRGGAVFVRGDRAACATPLYRDCLFWNNLSATDGGAVSQIGGCSYDRGVEFLRCRFVRNRSLVRTGALDIRKTVGVEVIDLQDCTAEGNEAPGVASFMYYNTVDDLGADFYGVRLRDCDIYANRCDNGKRIVYVYVSNRSNPSARSSSLMENCVVRDHVSDALMNFSQDTPKGLDTVLVRNNIFVRNTGQVVGAGSRNGQTLLYDNTFLNNKARSGNTILIGVGGNIKVNKNLFLYNNNAICPISPVLDSNAFVFSNNLVIGNRSPRFLFSGGVGIPNQSIKVVNNLFLNNEVVNNFDTVFPYTAKSNTSTYAYNNIFLNTLNKATGKLTLPFPVGYDSIFLHHNLMDVRCSALSPRTICHPTNIFAPDALFVDTVAQDYRLLPCSPAVNGGYNGAATSAGLSKDFGNSPRIQDGRVDIGPYEIGPVVLDSAFAASPACGGAATGQARFRLSNACPPFHIRWSGGAQTGLEAGGLSSGQYRFTLSDAKGRQTEAVLDIPTAPGVLAALSGDTLTCPGFLDGTLAASAQTSAPPVSYIWGDGTTGATRTGLAPGLYTVAARDALGCMDTVWARISDAPEVRVKVEIQDASNMGASDGTIALKVETGLGPFRYQWDNGATTASIGALRPGTYQVTILDGAGCAYGYAYQVKASSNTDGPSPALPAGIWPNPAKNTVALYFGAFESCTLFSSAGAQMRNWQRGTEGTLTVDLGDLPEGTYFYQFLAPNGRLGRGRLVLVR